MEGAIRHQWKGLAEVKSTMASCGYDYPFLTGSAKELIVGGESLRYGHIIHRRCHSTTWSFR